MKCAVCGKPISSGFFNGTPACGSCLDTFFAWRQLRWAETSHLGAQRIWSEYLAQRPLARAA